MLPKGNDTESTEIKPSQESFDVRGGQTEPKWQFHKFRFSNLILSGTVYESCLCDTRFILQGNPVDAVLGPVRSVSCANAHETLVKHLSV